MFRIDAVPYIWKELGNELQKSSTSAPHCPYAANDSGDDLSGCDTKRRGCYGTKRTSGLFWNRE